MIERIISKPRTGQRSSPPCSAGDFNPITFETASGILNTPVRQLRRLSRSSAFRLRTGIIYPEFFTNESLNDLESAHPELHPMLVLIGLSCACTNRGLFLCRPDQLKYVILPFDDFDIRDTIKLLESHGWIRLYLVEQTTFGLIPIFNRTQPAKQRESAWDLQSNNLNNSFNQTLFAKL